MTFTKGIFYAVAAACLATIQAQADVWTVSWNISSADAPVATFGGTWTGDIGQWTLDLGFVSAGGQGAQGANWDPGNGGMAILTRSGTAVALLDVLWGVEQTSLPDAVNTLMRTTSNPDFNQMLPWYVSWGAITIPLSPGQTSITELGTLLSGVVTLPSDLQISVDSSPAAVPEPAVWLTNGVILLACGGVWWYYRRKALDIS
jgi:hypothetical protein